MRSLLLVFTIVLAACGPSAAPPSPASATSRTKPGVNTMTHTSEEVITRTDAEWRKILTPEQYHVMRESGTERAFTGEYDKTYEKGTYHCAACDNPLFASETKFNSGCGWPAFYLALAGDRIKQISDISHGMKRTEVRCAKCNSHLGHVFDDAPDQPTGQRYCINSVALKFVPASK